MAAILSIIGKSSSIPDSYTTNIPMSLIVTTNDIFREKLSGVENHWFQPIVQNTCGVTCNQAATVSVRLRASQIVFHSHVWQRSWGFPVCRVEPLESPTAMRQTQRWSWKLKGCKRANKTSVFLDLNSREARSLILYKHDLQVQSRKWKCPWMFVAGGVCFSYQGEGDWEKKWA